MAGDGDGASGIASDEAGASVTVGDGACGLVDVAGVGGLAGANAGGFAGDGAGGLADVAGVDGLVGADAGGFAGGVGTAADGGGDDVDE